jgi:hypothetical protein
VIAPPTTPLPTTATSITSDTREFSRSLTLDNSNVLTTQQAAAEPGDGQDTLTSTTTTSPGPADTDLLTTNATSSPSSLLSQDPSSTTSDAGSEVVVSVGALVVAVLGLAWVFAEL